MCFLRSIENITVGRLRAGGHIQLLTELRAPLNKEWLNYRSKWPSDWESYAAESFTSQDLCACFRKSIVERRRGSSSVHDFIVASRLPADARDFAIEHCGETRFALAPVVSVALDLRAGAKPQLFSGLPMAEAKWTVHIDGFFEFPSARRGITWDSECNVFVLSKIMPQVHRDLILHTKQCVLDGSVKMYDYLRLFVASHETQWEVAASELSNLLKDLPVLPLVNDEWGAPSDSHWLPPEIRTLKGFHTAMSLMGVCCNLVKRLNISQVAELRHLRMLDADVLGESLRSIHHVQWVADDALEVLQFSVGMAHQFKLSVSTVLEGTRLLCLQRPTNSVVVFGKMNFYEPHLADLIPQWQVASPKMKRISGFSSFPGMSTLSPEDFSNLSLESAFPRDLARRLRQDGFAPRNKETVAWHDVFCMFVEMVPESQRQQFLDSIREKDWPMILTDDAVLSGQYMTRVVPDRNLAEFHAWQPVLPPVPHVLVWAPDVLDSLLPTQTKLNAILPPVLQSWATMRTEECLAWSEHFRKRVYANSQFVRDMSQALKAPSTFQESLPAFLARVFFLLDIQGGVVESSVSLPAMFLGDLLRMVEKTWGQSAQWSSAHAMRALRVILEAPRHDSAVGDPVHMLRGTRLMCLSTGNVAVFGEQCVETRVDVQMLELLCSRAPAMLKLAPLLQSLMHHVLQSWASMSVAQHGVWSRHLRQQARAPFFLAEMHHALRALSAAAKDALPALLAYVFFSFHLGGGTVAGSDHLSAMFLGNLLRLVEMTCGRSAQWSTADAMKALQVIASVAWDDHVDVQDVLCGTRLLCLSDGRVEVFGAEEFCFAADARLLGHRCWADHNMLSLHDFNRFPGLVHAIHPDTLWRLSWNTCAVLAVLAALVWTMCSPM
mmetsp:Transcript_5602/g.21156  ORF Transcript_5602/g.21156 Transcript_5602/m.21156 type:complete len:891 (+) Transcript_5602:375-3047(+)